MTEQADVAAAGPQAPRRYDRRSLTYAATFPSPWRRAAIRGLEWATARPAILARVRAFERRGDPRGAAFWTQALDVMGIRLDTPAAEAARIPATGPVVLVANHPHGLVDGMVLGALVSRRRPDWRILTRALLTGIDEEAAAHMIPVPFPHEPDAQGRMVAMRARALAHLAQGGLVALFPAGGVAAARTPLGPPVEGEWSAFTAKLIRLSGATVVPVFFPGANSRLYHAAGCVSATLRQGLLLHEIARAFDRPQRPRVGAPIPFAALEPHLRADPRGAMTALRSRTLGLGGACFT